MKNIVVLDEFDKTVLKPKELLQKYFQQAKKDVALFLIKGQSLESHKCPGCQEAEKTAAFKKFGLNYVECPRCGTLYVSAKPSDISLHRYYIHSKARNFWRNELSKDSYKKRSERIIRPRFQWIAESASEYLSGARCLVDVNTALDRYVDEISALKSFKKRILLNPFLNLSKLRVKSGIDIINTPISKIDLREEADIVSMFEAVDHTSDVEMLFNKIGNMLKPGGLCFLTSILISGFDLQVLWDKAENLYPPDRLNVFSAEGLRSLFKRHNFECLEFSTPGVLDVELVYKAYQKNPEIGLPRFVEYLLKNRDDSTRIDFQSFLQSSLLSSYSRILIRKS